MDIETLFGSGKDLTTLQMCMRGLVVFIITLVLIRISGRRSFGVKAPLDNIVVILLGALLSRAVVGASPFVPIIVVSFMLVILHRAIAWVAVRQPPFHRMLEGEKILLYRNGEFIEEHIKHALVCKEDIMQGVRESALTNDMSKIEAVYIERNGVISVIKREQ